MTDWYGWAGTILRVDLSSGKITKEPLTRELVANYIGGRGINSKILYDETGPETDAMGPDNRLIIGTGPATGSIALGNGRFTVTGKSPLTNILGDASGGGHFGAEVKFAGYDHIVFQGRAKNPVYLWVNDDEVVIKDARHLWGKNTWETDEIIRQEHGDRDIKTLSIGQAGENLCKYASPIAHDERVPAETGMGCIMGSKNLKAVAVRGSRPVKIARPDRYMEIIRKWYEEIPVQASSADRHDIGTPILISLNNMYHSLSTRNSQELHRPEEEIRDFYGENFVPKYLTRHIACFTCPMSCQKFVQIYDGPRAGEKGMRPEFGPLLGLCAQLGIFNFAFGLKIVNLANQYGINAQELGPTMAMAFECYQRGILKRKDTDGLKLEWGNEEVVLELVRKIAFREGFGDILADGCVNATKKIGHGAEQYAYHVKGKSHPDRITDFLPVVLGFAVSTRGWDHLRGTIFPQQIAPEDKVGFWDYDPKVARLVRDREHIDTMADSIEVCKFLTEFATMPRGKGGIPRMTEVLNALTGFDFTEDQMHQACERIYNVERAYLVKAGIRRKDDTAPHHFFDVPVMSGPGTGKSLDRQKFGELMDVWYDLRGQDRKTGAPKKETLAALGLKKVVQDMEKTGVYQE